MMEDIELVIKIPKELLEYFANHNCMSEDGWFSHSSELLDAFRNGKPLPKGHGRLFDERDIVNGNYEVIGNRIYELEPIIEADKESE